MAEVAGLVLGGIPLVILALEKYAEPFEAYHRYRISIDTFRSDLVLQKRQLQTTFSNIGLSGELTMDDLRECFESQFPDISAELMSIVQRMNQLTTDLLKELDVDVKGRPNLLPEKLQWEWRRVKHSVTIKKRNKIIEDLRHWNQDLKGCLEKTEVPAEDESHKVQDLKRLFNPKRCDALRQSLSSLHSALGSGFTCDCASPSHEAAIDLDWAFYESAANPFKVAISYKAESQRAKSEDAHVWRKLHVVQAAGPEASVAAEALNHGLPTPDATPKGTPSPQSSFTSKSVLFNVPKSVSKTSTAPSEPSAAAMTLALEGMSITPKVANQVKDICAAVCASHGPSTPPWIIRDDEEGKHFSLCHSGEPQKNTKRVPIKSLLAPAGGPMQRRRWPMLSARQRYGLAVAIAWSVLHLGDGPWLKDLWDQEQMSVFVENRGRQEVICRHPCASYSFPDDGVAEHSPEADSFYNHVSQKTVMSLGVLLVELCINEPISGTASVLDVQNAARNRLEDVYCLAGDSYGWATARCIKFAFEGRESYSQFCFSTFRRQFHDEVIAPLKATYMMFPETCNPVVC